MLLTDTVLLSKTGYNWLIGNDIELIKKSELVGEKILYIVIL